MCPDCEVRSPPLRAELGPQGYDGGPHSRYGPTGSNHRLVGHPAGWGGYPLCLLRARVCAQVLARRLSCLAGPSVKRLADGGSGRAKRRVTLSMLIPWPPPARRCAFAADGRGHVVGWRRGASSVRRSCGDVAQQSIDRSSEWRESMGYHVQATPLPHRVNERIDSQPDRRHRGPRQEPSSRPRYRSERAGSEQTRECLNASVYRPESAGGAPAPRVSPGPAIVLRSLPSADGR